MPPKTLIKQHFVNHLPDIFYAMRNGTPATVVDVAGKTSTEEVQGIAREGGKDYWIIQTRTTKVCVKAA